MQCPYTLGRFVVDMFATVGASVVLMLALAGVFVFVDRINAGGR